MTSEDKINEIHAILMESGCIKSEVQARSLLERSLIFMVTVQSNASLPSSIKFELNKLLKDIGEYLK